MLTIPWSGASLAEGMIDDVDGRDALARVRGQHLVQQVHEHLVAVEAVTLEFTEHTWYVLEKLLLLYQYFLLVSLRNAEQSGSKHALAIDCLHAAL